MRVAVVDGGSGNLASVLRALAVAAGRSAISAEIRRTDCATDIEWADRIVLPGQGAFAACGEGIRARPGLWEALDAAADKPFLGICVGMQLMAALGREHRASPGFGWIAGEIGRLPAPGLRLPHMGWNTLSFVPGHPLVAGLVPGEHVYFVHSYALTAYNAEDVIATAHYGETFPAFVVRGARAGTQFHVEKSQEVGLRILANFLRWTP